MENNSCIIPHSFDERKYIYLLKAFAIFSVLAAHTAPVTENTIKINNIFSSILTSLGAIGVGIFFLISGYLFSKNKKNFFDFFLGKIDSIFLPWMITGTAVYIYIFIVRNHGVVSLYGFLHFIFGGGSYLYYLTVLTLLYVLYFKFLRNKKFLIATLVLSCVSIMLTSMGLLDGIIPSYVNPANWMLYFSIGIFINEKYSLYQVSTYCKKYCVAVVVTYVMNMALHITLGYKIAYWSYFAIPSEILAMAAVFGLASHMVEQKSKIPILLGRESFAIYLLNVPIAGIITNITNSLNLWYLTLLRPMIGIAVIILFILLYKYILTNFKMPNMAYLLIGCKK